MNDSYWIATQARRYRLLAERPELLYPDAAVRAERLLAEHTKPPLDVILLAGVDDLDRLCAAAVATLSEDGAKAKPILALLGVLPANYLLAIYHALPIERRGQCERDEVWAYHLRRIPDGIGKAAERLADLAAFDEVDAPEQILDSEDAAAFRQFSHEMLKRAIGMPHELSATDAALVAAGEQVMAEMGYGD
jgi:hypothetical protein